jgi:uncharacterized protein involved in exopolysaccharide biosynthesis
VEQVRARRMVAAIEYHEGVKQKLEYEAEKVRKKMLGQYEMLRKEIDRLDRALENVEKRLTTIGILQQEIGVVYDMANDLT